MALKAAVWIFLTLVATGHCGDIPPSTGLVGPTTIIYAEWFLEGGSVTMTLQDETGTKCRILYKNNWLSTPEEHQGQIELIPADSKSTWVPRNGGEENAVIALVQAACIATFGTADPQKLRELPGNGHTVSSFFSQIAHRVYPRPSE